MTTILLTLFEFAERVARMREAQRRHAQVNTLTSQRTMLALEKEVDEICSNLGAQVGSDELREFGVLVMLMRRDQNRARLSKSAVLAAHVLQRESDVDSILRRAVQSAKLLNALLSDQD